jgi:uncharacterized delta-60 repeat protein
MNKNLLVCLAFILAATIIAGCDAGPTVDTTTTTVTSTTTSLAPTTTARNLILLAIDSQGRLVVAGYSYNGTNFDMTLWRFTSDGVSDEAFGTHGMVTYNGGYADMATALVIDPSDNIFVTGFTHNFSNDDLAVWKYDSNGALDLSFGIGGVATFDSGGQDFGQGIALDHLQNILVAGYINVNLNGNLALWRFTPQGMPDATFGNNGLVIYDAGPFDGGYGVTEDSSHGVLVTGITNNGSNEDMVLLRYNQDGTTDESFGAGGRTVFEGGRSDYGYAVIADQAGSILIAGSSMLIRNNDMVIWKYTSSGATDESFGTGGRVVYDGGYDNEAAKSIKLDAAGKILTAGYVNNYGSYEATVWRYAGNGTADTSFGQNGKAAYISDQSSFANGLAVNSSGEIFSAGNIYGPPYPSRAMGLWKY